MRIKRTLLLVFALMLLLTGAAFAEEKEHENTTIERQVTPETREKRPEVVLALLVSESGIVEDIYVETSSGYEEFDNKAISIVAK